MPAPSSVRLWAPPVWQVGPPSPCRRLEPEMRKKLGFEGRRVGKGGHITIAGCRQVSDGVLTAGMAAAEPLQPERNLLRRAAAQQYRNGKLPPAVGTSAIAIEFQLAR